MTNEDIFSSNPGRAENVGYWTHAQMKVILRLMSLARADELRKMAGEAEAFVNTVSPSSEQVAFWLRCNADVLEREAREL